jgi:exopolyphosphatase/guanosine-5'-triphosphate,3'-diphosphate pyrophosphatase
MSTMQAVIPRWEWRTFGSQFPKVESELASLQGTVKTSTETYLLCRTADVNVKIRGGELDVKRLHQVKDGLELWSPVLKAAFPLPASTVREIFDAWQLTPPLLERPAYSREQLLSEVVAAEPAVSPVDISKDRRQVQLDGCSVEHSAVSVGAQRVWTVAVESESPERIAPLVRRLGLSGLGNENYVAALFRLSGRRPHNSAQEGAAS